MICLNAAETHLSTFATILYICLWIPFLQTTQAASRFLTFLLDPHHQPEISRSGENPEWDLDLPVSRFQDFESRDGDGGEADSSEEMCSICLMEFEKEDMMNKLPRCGHVFHMGCLEKWLDRCQFTCPLCRSSMLRVRSSPCKTRASAFCIDLPLPDHDS